MDKFRTDLKRLPRPNCKSTTVFLTINIVLDKEFFVGSNNLDTVTPLKERHMPQLSNTNYSTISGISSILACCYLNRRPYIYRKLTAEYPLQF